MPAALLSTLVLASDSVCGQLEALLEDADDQLETYLHRQHFGSGTLGLAGMRVATSMSHLVGTHTPALQRMQAIRPFLNFSKKQMMDYCAANDVFWVEDPTNRDVSYRRNANRAMLAGALHAPQASLKQLCSCLRAIFEQVALFMRAVGWC